MMNRDLVGFDRVYPTTVYECTYSTLYLRCNIVMYIPGVFYKTLH